MKWLPSDAPPKAVLIINHGMAEHIARYDDFARFMAEKGFAVYGEDHRGHGKTAGSEENCGFFADEKGWMKVIGDIRALYLLAVEEQKNLPVYFFGHSMGSFLTRHYLSLYGNDLSGVILSGTGSHPGLLLAAAKGIAAVESLFRGRKHRSKVLDTMSFGSFNKPFQNEFPEGFGWLSRDREQVKKYLDDPYCGFICTSGMFGDLFSGLQIINNPDCFRSTPSDLPMLIYSGTADPVGGTQGKGVQQVHDSYKRAGIKNLTLTLKKDFRHECLNEEGREEVFNDIFEWLSAV